ncbi:penicillin acylase family protein [Thauera sinica]|uniref:Penicillin acylase family protein n=1 Tax=Thauera sinica TaxID=2665146 RepID=A0ABW1AQQ4_9RHOO|nr:penicillin acylase family protein [Thauera sp. K11]ATE59691.1 peptidase S45 [Thauera sp. K11]
MTGGILLKSGYGAARVDLSHPQLAVVDGDSHLAVYYAQGYASARLRLWQLDLTRRLASGRLGEVLGRTALSTDRFQRSLDLTALAERAADDPDGAAEREHLQAYVDGINQGLAETRLLPPEFLALGYRPQPFRLIDAYLVAQLKYFINSAWQFELYHTLVTSALGTRRSARLFSSIDEAGATYPSLPTALTIEFAGALEELLLSAKAGLERLGLESPDIGSNVFAVRGRRTRSGFPLLANDPHMGLVNPGFNLIFHLRSAEGLDAFGSNFPGAPGIVVGRNPDIAWGMTGVMMDNQDLFWGEVDLPRRRVKTSQGWQALTHRESDIGLRGGKSQRHDTYGFAGGQLLTERGGIGLFLRWPALDQGLGSVSLHALNRARNWDEFRVAMARLQNSPGLAAYADGQDNIGTQIYGLLPIRAAGREAAGSLVLPLEDVRWAWQGYVPFDDLPRQFNPAEDAVMYANQYSPEFAASPYLSNRWHPPSRARRIRTLLDATPRLDAAAFSAIQDDRVDVCAEVWLPRLWAALEDSDRAASPLAGWRGDTRQTEPALLFERWVETLCVNLLASALPLPLATRYLDLWPAHRWNLLAILFEPDADWPRTETLEHLIRQAFRAAQAADSSAPSVDYRHTLRRYPLLRRLLSASHPFEGGSRETVSALRRNCDFLTAGQGGEGGSAYSFGTSFKMVFDLAPGADNLFLSNMPNSGNPFGFFLKRHLHRWRSGRRYVFRFP